MRKRIYEVIEIAREGDRLSNVYDVTMMAVICLSLLPLMFKESTPLLHGLDRAIAMVSSLFGIAIVALPAGIITAGYMKELEKEKETEQKQAEEEQRRRDKTEPKPL